MQRKKQIELSVVVPVYRQEKKIVSYLLALKNILDSLNLNYEIICVIDGFDDKSYENARKIASSNLRVLGYKKNQGKGNAVKFGLARTRGNIVGFADAGFDLNYSAIPLALEHMKWYDADIIIGSKRHPASKVIYPLPRRILSSLSQLFIRLLFGINVRDTQVGMKFFKKRVIKKILPKLLVKAWAFDIELLVVARSKGFTKIYEFPVEINLEFGSGSMLTSNFFKALFSSLWDTLAVFYRLRILHYYDDKIR
jgi:glycosyltransferase involved in cell wall biosynthesis